jgi:hypothetical protein
MITDEKDRLECLKLAVSALASHPNKPGFEKIAGHVVETAKAFQAYVGGATVIQFERPLSVAEIEDFKRLWRGKHGSAA